MEQPSFTLGEVTYTVTKLGLRAWLELEDANKKTIDYMKGKSMAEAAASICSYLSIITKLDVDELKTFFWLDIANAYITILLASIPSIDFPLLKGKTENIEPISWDYEGRTWYMWSHILASKYGWTLEYIADMYFEDAIALIQETLLEEQLQKEWEWGLTEIAYPNNKITKKREFKALPRPSWMVGMRRMTKPIETAKIPVSMIPQGIVLQWKKNEATVN